ncbi:GAF domain-containing protein, partial [Nocardioides marmoraquaticus]
MGDPVEEALELLLEGASRARLDGLLAALPARQRDLLLRVQDQMQRQADREAELSALYDTARDLTAIRDLDAILTAIVRRARQLLGADMTYLSLNDEDEGASYMKVTDGALTAEFRRLRLPLGTGLLGLVAQSGAPYFTEDYQSDARFLHRGYIDDAVAGEQIRAILGVPLVVEGVVIGTLLAVHRRVRPFPVGEVTLLTSFAAHAAVALENARLFARAREAVASADAASAALRTRTEATERAAQAHDRLTDVLLRRGGVDDVAEVLTEVLGGTVSVHDEAPDGLGDAADRAQASGRCVRADDRWVAVAAAGEDRLGVLVLHPTGAMDLPERRTLERGAMVTAMVRLFDRSAAEAESRVRGELLLDLVAAGPADLARLRERARQRGARLEPPLAV